MAVIRLLTTMRTQDAVYWSPRKDDSGRIIPDDRGRPVFVYALPVKVFWVDSFDTVTDAGDKEFTSKARVFLGPEVEEATGDEVDQDGVLWKGLFRDLTPEQVQDPLTVPKAATVRLFTKTPTFTAGEFVRVAYL